MAATLQKAAELAAHFGTCGALPDGEAVFRRLELQCACPPLAALIVGGFFASQKKNMQALHHFVKVGKSWAVGQHGVVPNSTVPTSAISSSQTGGGAKLPVEKKGIGLKK